MFSINAIPCFYMDGTMGANEMVFLSPKDYEDSPKIEYKIGDIDGNQYDYAIMNSGRYIVDSELYNADFLRSCLTLPKEERAE